MECGASEARRSFGTRGSENDSEITSWDREPRLEGAPAAAGSAPGGRERYPLGGAVLLWNGPACSGGPRVGKAVGRCASHRTPRGDGSWRGVFSKLGTHVAAMNRGERAPLCRRREGRHDGACPSGNGYGSWRGQGFLGGGSSAHSGRGRPRAGKGTRRGVSERGRPRPLCGFLVEPGDPVSERGREVGAEAGRRPGYRRMQPSENGLVHG